MISRASLTQAARTQQTTELNVAREYCQHLFLSAFYRQAGSEQVMFKGGTALRIVFGSPRFSEDLDFSGFSITVDSIENWVLDATGEFEQHGIGVQLEESKTTLPLVLMLALRASRPTRCRLRPSGGQDPEGFGRSQRAGIEKLGHSVIDG